MSASVEKLKAARALIAQSGGWTQRAYARDAAGDPLGKIAIEDGEAQPVCYCASGALGRVGVFSYDRAYGLVMSSTDDGCPLGLLSWNDRLGRTQAEVVAVFDRAIDRAIALAEAEAA